MTKTETCARCSGDHIAEIPCDYSVSCGESCNHTFICNGDGKIDKHCTKCTNHSGIIQCSVCHGHPHLGTLLFRGSNDLYGSLTASRVSGQVIDNSSITLSTTNTAGCKLDGWYVGDTRISGNASVTTDMFKSYLKGEGKTTEITARFNVDAALLDFELYKSDNSVTQSLIDSGNDLIIAPLGSLMYFRVGYIPLGDGSCAKVTPRISVVSDIGGSNIPAMILYDDYKVSDDGYSVKYRGLNLNTERLVTQNVYQSQLTQGTSGTKIAEIWDYRNITMLNDGRVFEDMNGVSLNVLKGLYKLPESVKVLKNSDITEDLMKINGVQYCTVNEFKNDYEKRDTLIRSKDLPFMTSGYIKVVFAIEIFDNSGNSAEYNMTTDDSGNPIPTYDDITVYFPLDGNSHISIGY